MHTLGKMLGLALLEAVVCLTWSMFSMPILAAFGIPIEQNVLLHVVASAFPVMLLGGFLAHLWGLWRADWIVRVATAATCLVIPVASNFPFIGFMLLLGWNA